MPVVPKQTIFSVCLGLSTDRLVLIFLALALSGMATQVAAADGDAAVRVVDAFQALFGAHRQFRPVHAKGVICEGDFTPAPDAASLSRAEHLQAKVSPVIARFSSFAGFPQSPDTGAFSSPQGMSIKFMLPDGADTDIVAHFYNGFPVSTAEEFVAFLKALAAATHEGPSGQRELAAFAAASSCARVPR